MRVRHPSSIAVFNIDEISRMALRIDGITWFTNVDLLRCLTHVASDPSIPYLNDAADITCRIITMIEGVKDTKTHFQTLGRATVALFSTAFEVYLGSDVRRWANYHLVETFDEMLRTLRTIQRFIKQYSQTGSVFRTITLVPKRRKFKRFRKMVDDVAGRLDLHLHRNKERDVHEGPSTIFFTQNTNYGSVIDQGTNIVQQGPFLDHSHSLTDHGQLHNDHNQLSARVTNANHGVANEVYGKRLPELPLLRCEQHNVNQTDDSSDHEVHTSSPASRDDQSYDSCSATRDDDPSSSFILVEYPTCKSC